MSSSTGFSEFIVYVDESGDHSLESINPQFPVFVLACCIVKKSEYLTQIVPSIQQLKFDFFGHDMIVLHTHKIRKSEAPFNLLLDSRVRTQFFDRLNLLVEQAPFTIIASAIKKQTLTERYRYPANPYNLAVVYCLERLYELMKEHRQESLITHVIFESRGKKEDQELELEFRRTCDGENIHKLQYPFRIVFSDKQINSGGLQLADLIAHPIARHVINPQQNNRAFEILTNKFMARSGNIFQAVNGKNVNSNPSIQDWGLKIFP